MGNNGACDESTTINIQLDNKGKSIPILAPFCSNESLQFEAHKGEGN